MIAAPPGWVVVEEHERVSVVTLHGEHDMSTVRALEHALLRCAMAGRPVVVDLAPAEFVDLTVVRVLLAARRGPGDGRAGLVLRAPADSIAGRLLALTGLGDRFDVAGDLPAAIGRAAGPIPD